MKDLTLLAGRDWRGTRVQPGDVPSLSHFVERALQFEASGDAAARAALLSEWARQGWPAARMARELIDGAEVALGPERLAADIRRLRRRVTPRWSCATRPAPADCPRSFRPPPRSPNSL